MAYPILRGWNLTANIFYFNLIGLLFSVNTFLWLHIEFEIFLLFETHSFVPVALLDLPAIKILLLILFFLFRIQLSAQREFATVLLAHQENGLFEWDSWGAPGATYDVPVQTNDRIYGDSGGKAS